MKKNLIIIGGGVLQESQLGVAGKFAVVNYLEELSAYFAKTYWAAQLSALDEQFETKIDIAKVEPIVLQKWYRHPGQLRSYLDTNTIVLQYLPFPQSVVQLSLLAKLRRVAGLFIYVANDFVEYSKLSRQTRSAFYSYIYYQTYKISILLADGVIARGKKLSDVSKQWNQNVIQTVPIGLRSAVVENKNMQFEKAFDQLDEELSLLYVGKILEGKGVFVLCEVVKELLCRNVTIRLSVTIVGKGENLSAMKQFVKEHKLEDSFEFVGYVDNANLLTEYYSQADMLIVPSIDPEGVPRVIDEAIAHDCLVVASQLDGIGRQYANGEIISVPPGNHVNIADEISRLIEDSEYLHKCLKSMRVYKERMFGRSSPAKQHAEFLLSNAEGRR